MGAYTAQILVGMERTIGEGVDLTHQLLRYEGDRPVWTIHSMASAKPMAREGSLIPRSPEHIEHDALVLVAAGVVRDRAVRACLGRLGALEYVDLTQWGEADLAELDAAVARVKQWPPLFLTHLDREEAKLDAGTLAGGRIGVR